MTDPAIPKYNELMWPTLRALRELGQSGTIEEIVEKVSELEHFSEAQQQVLHKDGPRSEIEYRLAWARTYLKGVGAVDNSKRGVWSLTERGTLLTEAEMAAIPATYRASWRAAKKALGGGVAVDDAEAEVASSGEPEATDLPATWQEQLLSLLLKMAPDAFERLAKRLLREAGFVGVTVTGKSGDGGIDGTGVYRLSLVSFPVFFQCKRWKGSVSSAAVRDFRGAMVGRGEKGLLITTASFTADAKREATRDGAPPVDLIDGDRLCDLLKDYGLGIRTEERVVEDVRVLPQFFQDL